jgi:peroxiredoxin Q/BCP
MPEVVVVDRRGTEPTITYTHKGSSTFDRPEIDEILAALDELRVGA